MSSSFESLQERLAALQETTAQLKTLIDRLADLKFQPGSVPLPSPTTAADDEQPPNVATELAAEINQILRDEDDELELLREEITDLRAGGRPGSDAEHRKQRLREGVKQLETELKTYVVPSPFPLFPPSILTPPPAQPPHHLPPRPTLRPQRPPRRPKTRARHPPRLVHPPSLPYPHHPKTHRPLPPRLLPPAPRAKNQTLRQRRLRHPHRLLLSNPLPPAHARAHRVRSLQVRLRVPDARREHGGAARAAADVRGLGRAAGAVAGAGGGAGDEHEERYVVFEERDVCAAGDAGVVGV